MLQRHPLAFGTSESHAHPVTDPVRRHGPRSARGWAAVIHKIEAAPDVRLLRYADRSTLVRLAAAASRSAADGDDAADRFVTSVFDHYARMQGAGAGHVLVEKTPHHLWRARPLLDLFPSARMIEVVRDGRDVCVSMQMRAPYWAWLARDRADQIRTWASFVEEGERLRSDPTIAGRVLRVRYEDLKAEPRVQLSRMFDFAGLDATEDDIDGIVAATDIARYSGPTDPSSPIRKGVVGDWRNHFTDDDVELFWAVAGATAQRAGYTP